MILTVDIGNSNIVIGAFENDKLSFSSRIVTNRHIEADQYALEIHGILNLYNVKNDDIKGIIISSVVPRVTEAVNHALCKFCAATPVFFNKENANVKINIDNPSELGADILASAVAVKKLHKLPAVAIDMGTATTISAIDKNGAVQGVAIFPGLFISLDALTSRTSLLRQIEIEAPLNAIGKNTQQSMKSGVVFGNAAMLDGMLERFEQELGTLNTIVATGGASGLIAPHCKHKILYAPNLLLEGLYIAYCKIIGGEG